MGTGFKRQEQILSSPELSNAWGIQVSPGKHSDKEYGWWFDFSTSHDSDIHLSGSKDVPILCNDGPVVEEELVSELYDNFGMIVLAYSTFTIAIYMCRKNKLYVVATSPEVFKSSVETSFSSDYATMAKISRKDHAKHGIIGVLNQVVKDFDKFLLDSIIINPVMKTLHERNVAFALSPFIEEKAVNMVSKLSKKAKSK